MDHLGQNKYKENLPLDTVQKIRNILHSLDIYTIDKWTDSKVDECYSVRVEIAGTRIGQNGKGATPEFALASAYAELMERVQNDLAYTGDYDEDVWEHCGFYYAPDERLMSLKELAQEDNPWIDTILESLRQKDNEIRPPGDALKAVAARLFGSEGVKDERFESLKPWSFAIPKGCQHDFVAIPFYSLKADRLYYIPVSILKALYGSNGTCAGNTPEEALVQGLSELLERHSNVKIINERITPPTIPEWYLAKYERLYGVIQQIKNMGKYKVIVKDCSLGSGFPVIASVLIDLHLQTYVVKFGAHPVFEIALERTLTEMFQGRDISSAAKSCWLSDGFEHVGRLDNLHNILKVASGQYPQHFFADNHSYEFAPFHENAGKSNSELLRFAVDKLVAKGCDIMVRDVSYLGFCSFQIVVPGYSELFNFGTQRLKEKRTFDSVKKIIRQLPDASDAEVEKLVRYMLYKRNWILENSLEFTSGLPLQEGFPGGQMAADVLLAACCYRLGRLKEAYHGFKYIAAFMRSNNIAGADYYACMRDYVGALMGGMGHDEVVGFLNKFYNSNILNRVSRYAEKPGEILKHLYSSLDCFNCNLCHASEHCSYPVIKKVRLRLKESYLESRIDQQKTGIKMSSILTM